MAARNFDAQQDASSHPIGQHHPIRVICIGAGYSGVMMSIIVEQKMKKHKAIHMTAVYIYKLINKLQAQSLKSMTVNSAAAKDYNEYSQKMALRDSMGCTLPKPV
ncbi:hypothetical protein LTS17_001340 [Exophiala oligosperma]